ncbi:hypothetical protein PTI98_007417 [Pleurotus ostreatus]|nr:hypothetical protein PTI98_007417 [Pleurotus ostreatus]
MDSPPMASAPMPPPPITPMGPPPHGLDFRKLFESYELIIRTGDSLSRSSAPGRPFPLDAIDEMLQSATYGVQIFESTSNLPASPALSEVRPPSEEQPPPEPQQPPQEPTTNGTTPAAKKQTEEPSQDGQTCLGCKATSTPEWRRGPMGPRTLCNACGLVYAKMIKKRTRESLRANGKTNGQNGAAFNGNGDDGASNGEEESDNESYASQDHKDA